MLNYFGILKTTFSKGLKIIPGSKLLQKPHFRTIFLTRILSLPGDYEYEDPKSENDVVNITYVLRDGTHRQVRGKLCLVA